jgi:DNA-binding CsgD family transcriptional regulator/N-acetylneuraminic acid mutarotase
MRILAPRRAFLGVIQEAVPGYDFVMPDIDNLSDREREILYLVATGVSNKQIAQALNISTNTVKVHLRNIFGKIEVASRTEAAMFAVSAGLVELPGEARGDGMNGVHSGSVREQAALPDRLALPTPADRRSRSPWYYLAGLIVVLAVGILAVQTLRGGDPTSPESENPSIPTPPPRWQEGAQLPTPRQGLAAVAYENLIYTIAGESQEGVTGMLERYDPETDRWTSLAPKPVPVTEVGAVVIGGKIYVPGGRTGAGDLTDAFQVYDPREDRWEEGPSLPVPLSGYAVTAFEGKLYLFGGWDGQAVRQSVYEFDPDAGEWSEHTPMPTARSFAGAAAANGKIYVFGGFDGEGPLAVNEVYQPDLDQEAPSGSAWTPGPAMPEPRYGMGVANVADIIHVFGGLGAGEQPLPPLEYPPQTLTWQAFESPLDEPWSMLGLVPYGTQLYLMGGSVEGKPTGRNLVYQAIYVVSLPVIR